MSVMVEYVEELTPWTDEDWQKLLCAVARERQRIRNTIPPITEPMGKYWDQPPVAEIRIDDEFATMSQKTFDALHDYSCSKPTGVYPGKMWRRHDGAFDRKFLAAGGKPTWLLVWFGESRIGPGFCSNNYRKIVII